MSFYIGIELHAEINPEVSYMCQEQAQKISFAAACVEGSY